jgi:hypothetical protein
MSKPILTQERLKELLTYDPETGVFVWVTRPNGLRRNGNLAGTNHHTGYRHIQIEKKLYASHCLAWLFMMGQFPPDEIDHINMDKKDSRFVNLRAVTRGENEQNRYKPLNNTSGFKSVSYHKRTKKWQASIGLNGVLKYLGIFSTPEDASSAYLAAQRIYHPTCPTI